MLVAGKADQLAEGEIGPTSLAPSVLDQHNLSCKFRQLRRHPHPAIGNRPSQAQADARDRPHVDGDGRAGRGSEKVGGKSK